MARKAYPSELTDAQWRLLAPHIPLAPVRWPTPALVRARVGQRHPLRAARRLPVAVPAGGLPTLGDGRRLCPRLAARWDLGAPPRRAAPPGPGPRRPGPGAERGHPRQPVGEDHGTGGPRGDDGGKKVSGRKRHLLVEPTGLLLRVVVHPANVADRNGGKLVLAGLGERCPRLTHLWADAAYQGPFATWVTVTRGWSVTSVTIVKQQRRWVRVSEGQGPPPDPKGFQVLPRRWVVDGWWSGRSGG